MSMSLTLHWFLTTGGDHRPVATGTDAGLASGPNLPGGKFSLYGGDPAAHPGYRAPDIDYLIQQARAADHLGFTSVLTPTGTSCEDAWLTAAALARETTRLKFLVAFRPGLTSPTLAAAMAATLQRQSRGRLLLNVVTGDDVEQVRFGDWLPKDDRYARTDEFLDVVKGIWSGEPYDHEGRFYHVRGATTFAPPDPIPGIYFGGSSAAALPVAGRHADVYLTWGEPPALAKEKIDRVRAEAAKAGRDIRFGIRFHVFTRDTSAEAWAETQRFLDAIDPELIRATQAKLRKITSEGQRRMLALHGDSKEDNLVVHPNVWAGIGLIRGHAGTALVGSHEEVADRIEEYHGIGIDEFVLSGYPNLEEAYWFGEGVLPILRRRGLLDDTPNGGAAGGVPAPAPYDTRVSA